MSEGDLRVVTPEQYHQGVITMGGWRIPFGLILRNTPEGNFIVREPQPDKMFRA